MSKKENNKNLRSWSNRYWLNNDISDILKEVIEPDAVDVTSIQMHDNLCPNIWEDEKMNADVRKTLLKNAKNFINYCDIEDLNFNDIILTGSLANYNYNQHSDLDVHIILNFNLISENKDFVGDFFKMKKMLWEKNYPIQIKSYDVEMYIQDSSEPHHSTGTYSIINNNWIVKPVKKIININTGAVQLKSANIMNMIDDLELNINEKDFIDKHEKLKKKIKKMRQSGLEKNGEFSVENLTFKILRNSGYLRKLADIKTNYITNELSLDEILNL